MNANQDSTGAVPPRSAFAGPPPPPQPEPATDNRFSVVFEDDFLAVVAKSGNLPCHPSGRYRLNTLERLLRATGTFPEVHFITRLDRETSGAVLVAKSSEAASALGRAMMRRRISKEYLCIVRGEWTLPPTEDDGSTAVYGDILAAGDELVHKYRRFVPCLRSEYNPETSTSALTRFTPLHWEDFGISTQSARPWQILRCVPETGRTHQIRATLFGLGHDVLGDKLYGGDRAIYARMCSDSMTLADRSALVISRQALHAWRISFSHPETGQNIAVEVPPDILLDEFSSALSLDKNIEK